MRYRIIRNFDDHEPVVLGIVERPDEIGGETIEQLWLDFQETMPDTDSDFLDFLEDADCGFTKCEDNTLDCIVG